MQTSARIILPMREIAEFCHRWHITELALFGSVLREDFRPDSDIDVLVTVEEGVHWPWGGYGRMTEELGHILGRKVDLGPRRGIEKSRNWIIRREILGSLEVVYTA